MSTLLHESLSSIRKLIELVKGTHPKNTKLGEKGELGKSLVFQKKTPKSARRRNQGGGLFNEAM